MKGAFEAMMAGKLNVTVECSPLLGPQLMAAVKDIKAGKPVPKRIVTEEGIFPMETAAQEFPKRKYWARRLSSRPSGPRACRHSAGGSLFPRSFTPIKTRRPTVKRSFLKTAAAVLALCAAGTMSTAQAQDKGSIGISIPPSPRPAGSLTATTMVKVLKERGYKTDLQYADDDIPNQLAQIENMVTKGAKVLVIASIDGTTLSRVLQNAADKGVKVIAYDRLIKGSKNVDYYATFDNFQVGVLQAQSIVDKLGLKQGKGPFNIELFGGSPDDNNAFFFYDGAMSVLQPYIDSGKLVVRSKQTGMNKVGTLRWDGAVAQARMDNLLSAYYGKDKLDAVLSPYDGLSIGILSSLKGVGYCTAQQPCPIVTGQDAEVPSVKSILKGEQYSTVFKDTRELAKVAANMVDAVLSGKQPEINDTKTYNNGVKVVPSSYLLKPVLVDKSNWKKILVDSGYYKESQLK